MNQPQNSKQPRRRKRAGPQEKAVLAYLAGQFLKYGASEKARILYSVLARQKPVDHRHWLALGVACLEMGRAQEALRHMETSFRGRESTLAPWEVMMLERAYRANGMVQEAKNLVRGYVLEEEFTI
jgi:hypothetical protein